MCWLAACQPQEVPVDPKTDELLVLQFEHLFDGAVLLPAQRIYQNAAGNNLSITRLEYIISQLELENASGEKLQLPGPWYMNAFDQHPDTLHIRNFKPVQLRLRIGLDSAQNQSHQHDQRHDFINMAWPDLMGGGYHFLKLEGRYLHPSDQERGYAFHLGKSEFAVPVNQVSHKPAGTAYLKLTMAVERWFGPPVVWELGQHASHTMMFDSVMAKLVENGKEVFREAP